MPLECLFPKRDTCNVIVLMTSLNDSLLQEENNIFIVKVIWTSYDKSNNILNKLLYYKLLQNLHIEWFWWVSQKNFKYWQYHILIWYVIWYLVSCITFSTSYKFFMHINHKRGRTWYLNSVLMQFLYNLFRTFWLDFTYSVINDIIKIYTT